MYWQLLFSVLVICSYVFVGMYLIVYTCDDDYFSLRLSPLYMYSFLSSHNTHPRLHDYLYTTTQNRLYKEGTKDVLVATDIAAKGLDFPDIQHVINFDMPGTCTVGPYWDIFIVFFGVYVMILCDWICVGLL